MSTRAQAKLDRRQALLDVAWDVVDREGERASMDDVAAAAGITRPILYRHFGDVGGLWEAIGERFTVELLGRLEGLDRRRGRAARVAVSGAAVRKRPCGC